MARVCLRLLLLVALACHLVSGSPPLSGEEKRLCRALCTDPDFPNYPWKKDCDLAGCRAYLDNLRTVFAHLMKVCTRKNGYICKGQAATSAKEISPVGK